MSAALFPEVLESESDKPEEKVRPDPGSPSSTSNDRLEGKRFLGSSLRKFLTRSRAFLSGAWRTLGSSAPLYVAFVVMAVFAVWQAQTPVTMIAPFQLPKVELPFSGDIVADALKDGLKSISNEIEGEKQDAGLTSSETGLPDLRNMLIPKFGQIQVPPRFTVEVKGLSYERILSIARAVMRTETIVSGDVILRGKEFMLVARTADGGPWESLSGPISAEGLKRATRDLAEKILATKDPTLAGVALLRDGQVDQGLAVLNRARSLNPTDVRLKLNLCTGFGANRRYAEAIECYKDVLKMNPSSPQEVSERLAQAYYLKGEREVAIQYYEELRKQGDRGALLGLGEALDDTGQHEDALKVYNEFVATERLDRNLAIAHMKRSAALAHLSKHGEALAEYQEALKYAPRELLILVHRGVELAEAGDLDAGIAQLQSVVDDNSNANSAPFAFLQLGILLQKKGDWRHASDQFRRATVLRPNYVEAHLKLAYALVHEGHRSDAFSEYGRVARLSSSDLDRGNSQILARQWVGNALREQGNWSAAASTYRSVIRLKPDSVAAHCELGFVLDRQKGQVRQGIQEYRAAIQAAKSDRFDSSESLVLAHQRLGEALLSERPAHRAEGINELRKAIELDPKHLEAYLSLGKALYDEGSYVEAASMFKDAIKINPQSAAAHNGLALNLDKQGLVKQAVLEYTAAVKLEPNNARYHANLVHELDLQQSNREAAAEHQSVAKPSSNRNTGRRDSVSRKLLVTGSDKPTLSAGRWFPKQIYYFRKREI
jgi:tetratricopeptide (TPR) repeat protein